MAIHDIIRKAAAHHPLSPRPANDALIPVTRLPGHVRIDPAKAIAVPGLTQAALQAQTAARYGSHALYEVILPPGASLKPHVRAGQDLFYGAGKTAEGKSIFPDFRKLSSAHETAQIAAAAMNAASLVVGQYYMSLIDGELKAIRGILQELLDLQYQIGCLAYTLMFGTASPEFCFSSYSAGLARARTACDALCAWHDAQIGRFGIDLHAGTRRRQGVDAFLHTIPRLIDRQHEQRPIGESTAQLLRTQMHPPADRLTAFKSKFEQSTRLLFDGETLYYLND